MAIRNIPKNMYILETDKNEYCLRFSITFLSRKYKEHNKKVLIRPGIISSKRCPCFFKKSEKTMPIHTSNVKTVAKEKKNTEALLYKHPAKEAKTKTVVTKSPTK